MKTYTRPLFLFCGASTAQSMLGVLSQRINSSRINLAHGFLYKRSLYTHTHTHTHTHTRTHTHMLFTLILVCSASMSYFYWPHNWEKGIKERKRANNRSLFSTCPCADWPCFTPILHSPLLLSLLPPLHCSHMFWFLPIGAANKIMVDTML